jgi:large repetitive protein
MGSSLAGRWTFSRRPLGSIGMRAVLLALMLLVGIGAGIAKAEETPSDTVTFSCSSETFNFTGFPNAPNNTVLEVVTVDGKTAYSGNFTFNGPTGENTVKVALAPGSHKIDARTAWNTNGVKGGKDIPKRGGLSCAPDPELSIVKKQHFAPKKGEYVTTTLPTGHVGQTVEYEVIVTNTGNVALTLGALNDPNCDAGTIAGGPGETALAPGASTTYTCKHVLTQADREAGTFTNSASVTGSPPPGEGTPKTVTSNPVVVELPNPTDTAGFSCGGVTFTFSGFPNLPNNTVKEFIHVDGQLYYEGTFTFNGSFGTNTIPLNLSPGKHKIDARAHWKTNTFGGGKDIPKRNGLICSAPEPGFDISKTQEIAGSDGGFTSAPLTGAIGQTDDYKIVVTNTGNVPITLSAFSDPNCDPGTIAGGPSGPLAPAESTTYTCHTALSSTGEHTNTASVTGTPPPGDGPATEHTSNTVSVNVPVEPAFTLVKEQASHPGGFTTAPVSGFVGQTIVYRVTVKNTGNVPLTFAEGAFNDPHCDEATLHEEFEGTLAPGESQIAGMCEHTLTEADAEAGDVENSATDTASPPEGDGGPFEVTSNTVVAEAFTEPS